MVTNAFRARWPWQTPRRVTSTNTAANGDPNRARSICNCPTLDGVTSAIQGQLDSKVPNTRTVNGKALSANITLSAADLGIVSITDDEIDTICGAAIAYAEGASF